MTPDASPHNLPQTTEGSSRTGETEAGEGLSAFTLRFGLLVVLWLAAPAAAADQSSKLETWVRALSSDRFIVREEAAQKLAKSGLAAVSAIDKALDRNDVEASARGVAVLNQIALSDNLEEEVAATRALDAMAVGNSPAAKQAQVQLIRLADRREDRAVERLQRAGMVARTMQLENKTQVYAVEFNDQWQGTMDELSQLQWLRGVQQVQITYPKANDQWMEYVAKLPQLAYLSIKRTQITDVGLKQLQPHKQPLQYVELKYMDVTDELVPHFAKMISLTRLRLFGTKITREAADELQKKLHLTDVDHRAGAFLGVSCTSHTLGCLITMVSEDTAADRCGIERGDVVIEYDGHSVADFDRLTKWISHNEVGDEVKILFARNMEVYEFELGLVSGKKSGLEVKPHKVGLKVAKVSSESPLLTRVREGDVVFRINETRVKTLKELDDAMAALKPEEEATVYVARGGEIFERSAKLGEWD